MSSKLDYENQLPLAHVAADEPGYRKIGLRRGLIIVGGARLGFFAIIAWFLWRLSRIN